MCFAPVIYVVDDDEDTRQGLVALVESRGMKATCFSSASTFLAQLDDRIPGCVLVDFRMEGLDGLELQAQLRTRGSSLPIIVVTGYADIASTVRFMERGAVTLLEKPVDPARLMESIERALARNIQDRTQRAQQDSISERLSLLNLKELEVASMVLKGVPNKRISQKMGTSMRTVDRRRRSILTKMQAGSVAEFARLVEQAGGLPEFPVS